VFQSGKVAWINSANSETNGMVRGLLDLGTQPVTGSGQGMRITRRVRSNHDGRAMQISPRLIPALNPQYKTNFRSPVASSKSSSTRSLEITTSRLGVGEENSGVDTRRPQPRAKVATLET